MGPLFNGTGCAMCHNVPVIGGGSPMTELRVGGQNPDGSFKVLGNTTLFQIFSIPDHRCQAAIPVEATVVARRVGRFGWKAQVATLLTFAGAYTNKMGITNDLFPQEPYGGISEARMRECDRVRDPEDVVDPRTGKRAVDNFEAFMKLLAPPSRGTITDEARTGEQVFAAVGCASCHTPALTTGAVGIALQAHADARRQRRLAG